MKHITNPQLQNPLWRMLLLLFLFTGCTELDLDEQSKSAINNPDLALRSLLSKEVLDSTINAEGLFKNNGNKGVSNEVPLPAGGNQNLISTASVTSVNYALQATVSAQSTYPGYSVLKIKDGSRNTTVGPSYSWANNYPDGTRLPQSVFLKFGSLKTINRIDVYTSLGYEIQNYTIQFRTTPTASWITLLSVVGNRSVYRSHTFTDVTVLEIQIICQLGPPNQTIYARLNEVEIYGNPEPTLPSISTENGILVFNTSDDIDQAISYLEYKYDQYSDAFASQYSGLNADQLADIEETTGFNDDKPYIDFENMYGINSLRALLASQEDNWLTTTAGDETAGTDPDDLYMADYEIRTLVNSDGYIKVGTMYYVFLSDNSYYSYDGGGGGGCVQCPIQLSDIKKLKPGEPLPEGVKYYPAKPITPYLILPDCKSIKNNSGFQYSGRSNGDWRFKWKVSVFDGPFGGCGRVKAVTKSYRKKYGIWWKRAAFMGSQVFGDIVHRDCSVGTSVDSGYIEPNKRKRRVSAKRNACDLAVLKNQLHGIHNHEKINGYISTLTW